MSQTPVIMRHDTICLKLTENEQEARNKATTPTTERRDNTTINIIYVYIILYCNLAY